MKIQSISLLFSLDDYMLPCANKKIFGVECPGCGIQRSISLLLQGDLWGAFLMYPAIYTLILLMGFLLVDNFYSIKYANSIIITLMSLTVLLIVTNYILKFI
ncbi:MAG: DUF2752 domain-containing protein [Sediminicola sp.]